MIDRTKPSWFNIFARMRKPVKDYEVSFNHDPEWPRKFTDAIWKSIIDARARHAEERKYPHLAWWRKYGETL